MVENVRVIRTILNGCKENMLTILYEDKNGSEYVNYCFSNLVDFKKRLKIYNNGSIYEISYTTCGGVTLNYNNFESDLAQYNGFCLISNEITEIIKHIHNLKNIKGVILGINDLEIIELYKLFYNENPDFSKKDIYIRVQAMIFILAEYGITLDGDYGFSVYGEKMPISLDLQQRVNRLYSLGKVSSIKNNIKINEQTKKVIKIIGDEIRKTIINEQNQNEALIKISKVIHALRYQLPKENDVYENFITEITKCSTDEVDSCMKLLKRIVNKVDENIKLN